MGVPAADLGIFMDHDSHRPCLSTIEPAAGFGYLYSFVATPFIWIDSDLAAPI